jgi:hypothetical protein
MTTTSSSPYLPQLAAGLLAALALQAQPASTWLGHDRTRPSPTVVTPGTSSTQDQPGKPPTDAIVLFGGSDLSPWAAMDGQPTKWVVKDGAMECVPGSGYVRTLRNFGDCQLHLEFAVPAKVEGSSQGRGNSGLFFGGTRYEIQVLDSFENKTYADGSCASVYNQYPPLVNASRKPGEWQSYDILWTAPRFDADAHLVSAPRITVFHNGVVVQNNVELFGETGWLERAPFRAHPEKLPIALQDHGNPVRYRNIWVRELKPGKPELSLAETLLDSYCGDYRWGRDGVVEVRRGQDATLAVKIAGTTFQMFAETPSHFFAKTVDVQCDFKSSGDGQTMSFSVGEDGGSPMKKIK